MSEYQIVVYFCLSFCRAFNKLLHEIDNENMEDIFDLLIVANLTDEDGEELEKVCADQIGLI